MSKTHARSLHDRKRQRNAHYYDNNYVSYRRADIRATVFAEIALARQHSRHVRQSLQTEPIFISLSLPTLRLSLSVFVLWILKLGNETPRRRPISQRLESPFRPLAGRAARTAFELALNVIEPSEHRCSGTPLNCRLRFDRIDRQSNNIALSHNLCLVQCNLNEMLKVNTVSLSLSLSRLSFAAEVRRSISSSYSRCAVRRAPFSFLGLRRRFSRSEENERIAIISSFLIICASLMCSRREAIRRREKELINGHLRSLRVTDLFRLFAFLLTQRRCPHNPLGSTFGS